MPDRLLKWLCLSHGPEGITYYFANLLTRASPPPWLLLFFLFFPFTLKNYCVNIFWGSVISADCVVAFAGESLRLLLVSQRAVSGLRKWFDAQQVQQLPRVSTVQWVSRCWDAPQGGRGGTPLTSLCKAKQPTRSIYCKELILHSCFTKRFSSCVLNLQVVLVLE